MNKKMKRQYRRNGESGAILVLSVIFVLMLLILGGSAVSTVILEERMASNLRNKNASFQAAEAALARAENYLSVTDSLSSANGIYVLSDTRKPAGDPGLASYWRSNFTWTAHSPHVAGDTAESIVVSIFGRNYDAYYVIEQLPDPLSSSTASEAYRITTYSPGAGSGSATYLQAYYTR